MTPVSAYVFTRSRLFRNERAYGRGKIIQGRQHYGKLSRLRRKFISHISPRCNWCGHEIQDAAYQAEAEIRREAHAIEEARHDRAVADNGFRPPSTPTRPDGFGGFVTNVPIRPPRRQISLTWQEVRQRMEAEAAIIAEAARARQPSRVRRPHRAAAGGGARASGTRLQRTDSWLTKRRRATTASIIWNSSKRAKNFVRSRPSG